jgi:ATP-binding cassette subfamily G (WHITE) protein 2 (PDR)
MFVDGKLRDNSFQRQTGYVQQQDLHLETSTVREALTFSALLRQSNEYSHQEKLDYVETVVSLLDMEEYQYAIVSVLGQGLNVEQRKRLTIGVELAARPRLLLFLDEPTSGLDSQTSWSICNLMRKLTDNGQAILCTIHQPSAMLFQRFDRLLLLARGGRTVYFGDIGVDSRTLIDYFARNGAPKCEEGANPAEYILQVIGAAAGSKTEIEWPEVWQRSQELVAVKAELEALRNSRVKVEVDQMEQKSESSKKDTDFAASFFSQMTQVLKRLLQQYWRSPSYIYSKAILSVGSVSNITADGPYRIHPANITSPGPLHRNVLLLSGTNPDGHSEPAVRCLSASSYFRHRNRADGPCVCRAKDAVRSPRTSFKDVQLASVRSLLLDHRGDLEFGKFDTNPMDEDKRY